MTSSGQASARRNGLSNIVRNLGWLLGGKGFAALASLAYLAILSRSLGAKDFGHFSLIFGTAQALMAIAGFQTWQTLVRFGARYTVEGDWQRFGRLAFMCGALDLGGALAGCLLAAAVFFGFSAILDLNPNFVEIGFYFSCALLISRMTTPVGIVRVLDRFDIGSLVEAIMPAGRLVAATLIVLTGASVKAYLIAWAALDFLVGALYWFAAWRLAPRALSLENLRGWRRAIHENKGLGGFFGITYASTSLDALAKQGPLLAVGYFLGTSAAGVYRLADQLAQAIGRFSQIIARAVYPEFVHSQIDIDRRSFKTLFVRVTAMAGLGGLAITLFALVFGEHILGLVGGDAFGAGGAVLVPLAIAASFELASVTFEPMFYATGHARLPLLARALSVVVMALGILSLVGLGPIGVGWAVCLGMASAYAVKGALAWGVLREKPIERTNER